MALRVSFLPVALTVLLASAASTQAAPLTLTKTLSPQQQEAAAKFWTRERIAAAKPMPLPAGHRLEKIAALPEDLSQEAALMESSAPGRPDLEADQIARAFYPEDWAALDQDRAREESGADETADTPAGTAGVYTSYDVNTQTALWQILPHKWSGKLTYTGPGGTFSCSATAISNNNIVTAAHCVYDSTTNTFFSNWAFTPAYRNGSTPYGTFTAKACTVLTSWVNLSGSFSINTWTRHDVAVCSLNTNSAGQTLNNAVGYAGRLWNASNTQLVFINGYPQRTYTDATITNGPTQYLRSCTAETFTRTTDTLGGGCNWGRGISGGSWLVSYKPFVLSGNVNSVVSGFIVGEQNLYGARFNSNNIVVLCNARGC